jgi:hypothetical protein
MGKEVVIVESGEAGEGGEGGEKEEEEGEQHGGGGQEVRSMTKTTTYRVPVGRARVDLEDAQALLMSQILEVRFLGGGVMMMMTMIDRLPNDAA